MNLPGERQKHFTNIFFWAHSHPSDSELLLLRLSSCCCCLCEIAVGCKGSGSAGHPLNFSAASFALLHRDAAWSQKWLMPVAVSCSGSGRALYSRGNGRSRLVESCLSCTASLSGNVSQGHWPCLLPSFHSSERMQQQGLLQGVFLYFSKDT